MKNYVQPGENVEVTLAADVSAGDFVVIGGLTGVAVTDGSSGDVITIARRGVFTLPKVSAQAWTQGAKIYWVSADSNFTTAASGNTLVGVAAEAAANPSATGVVLLDGAAR